MTYWITKKPKEVTLHWITPQRPGSDGSQCEFRARYHDARFRDTKQTRCLEILSAIGAYFDSMRWSGLHADLLSNGSGGDQSVVRLGLIRRCTTDP
jgi:hypothetical protein